jgi:hypothetical protein
MGKLCPDANIRHFSTYKQLSPAQRHLIHKVNSVTGLFIIATDLAGKTNSSTDRISRFFDKR